jgi:hypothetical protein
MKADNDSVLFPTLFDLISGPVQKAGPSVGDDSELPPPGISESIGPTVGDDGLILILVQN